MLAEVDRTRQQLSKATDGKRKARLGQFLTPAAIAAFMASLFPPATGKCRLLDAGAGIGSLSVAFLDRWATGGFDFERVDLDAFEIDSSLNSALLESFEPYSSLPFGLRLQSVDFVHAAAETLAGGLFAQNLPRYSHVLLNPPYKKISSHSSHRLALRRVGIETVNLYSAFAALAIALASPGAQIVAIIPRSFCNGPYYRPFREFLLSRTAIRHLHLFASRRKAFQDDAVLQENLILRLECGGSPGPVTVSTSTDISFTDLVQHEHPFERIVFPTDLERFIHVPTTPEKSALELSPTILYSLNELGIKISTGPVVDFRLKSHLRANPEPGTVPLLYPGHFSNHGVHWPGSGVKKPSAIERNAETERWLYPTGFYCVVRRLSSKEEARRVVASVVDPNVFGDATALGFENHLNVFHIDRGGLPPALARGLAVYLNTTAVDEAFRRFNGHTQVNATDLAQLRYPSRESLLRIGEWSIAQLELTQESIDQACGALSA